MWLYCLIEAHISSSSPNVLNCILNGYNTSFKLRLNQVMLKKAGSNSRILVFAELIPQLSALNYQFPFSQVSWLQQGRKLIGTADEKNFIEYTNGSFLKYAFFKLVRTQTKSIPNIPFLHFFSTYCYPTNGSFWLYLAIRLNRGWHLFFF